MKELITPTVIAIREQLMEYFKGTCIERFTTNGSVRLRGDGSPQRYAYQRREFELALPSILWISDVPILSLNRNPESILFHSTLDRSPQFRAIKGEVNKFMHNYLAGVQVSYEPEKIGKKDDSELLTATIRETPRVQPEGTLSTYATYGTTLTSITMAWDETFTGIPF